MKPDYGRKEKRGTATFAKAEYDVMYSNNATEQEYMSLVEADLRAGHRVLIDCWCTSSLRCQYVILTTVAEMVKRFGDNLEQAGYGGKFPEVVLWLKQEGK